MPPILLAVPDFPGKDAGAPEAEDEEREDRTSRLVLVGLHVIGPLAGRPPPLDQGRVQNLKFAWSSPAHGLPRNIAT
jgi:hypothetical protein